MAPPEPWRRFVLSWLRSLIWVDSAATGYDAFLSYSWKSDSDVTPAIQSVIQRFLCPWYKLRAKTVFRDLSCLPAGSSLEDELLARMDRSTHLIVLASPEAAQSHGMGIESRHWFGRQRDGQVLIVVTAWERKTWEEIRHHLLPVAVRSNLATEPLSVPLQHRRSEIQAHSNKHQLRGELIEDLKQVLLRFYPNRDWGQLTRRGAITEAACSTSVNDAAFSPDSQLIVTASSDNTARVWNATNGQLVAKLECHTGLVWHAAFSPDGRRIVTASNDKTARVYRVVMLSDIAELHTK